MLHCPRCRNVVLDGETCPACSAWLVTDAPPVFTPMDLGEPAPGEEDGLREDWVLLPEDFDRCP